MSNGIEKYQPPEIASLDEWAEKLYSSGMFQDAQSVAQAFVKIAAGAELGLTPFQSMSGVHLIKGKPVVGAGLLAALLDRDPNYAYTVEWEPDETNPTACTVAVSKNGALRGKSRFSLEDAKRAGILRDNWLKYPSAMLFARAMSQAVRWYAPGATGTSVYVEGELTADVEVTVPEGVTAKPRTRVTAEVIGPLSEPLAAGPLPLGVQLKAMSLQQRADLYEMVGIEKGTKLPDVRALLIAEQDALGLDFTEEPDALAILEAANRRRANKGSAEAFEIFAQTGQDVDPGDQVEFDEVMT